MGQTVRHEPPPSPSLDELVRITDVATELRRQRETVQQQLDLEATKVQLRERLLAAAKVTGENLTAEEVDAAIDQYYDSLHGFQPPKWSLSIAMAHLYIRRVQVATGLVLIAAMGLLCWWLFLAPHAPLSPTARRQRGLQALAESIQRERDAIQAIALDDAALNQLQRGMSEAEAYRKHNDKDNLQNTLGDLKALRERLEAEYTIHIVNRPGAQSAVDRFITDDQGERISGYYLIVEARTKQGALLARRIRNDETNVTERVEQWGQRVPQAVYERLKRDKQEDGILNEHIYAVKRKGYLDEQITLPDSSGQPVAKMGQITKW